MSEEEHGERGMDAHTSPRIQTALLRNIAPDVICMALYIFETVPRQLKLFGNFLENGEFRGHFSESRSVLGYIILYMARKSISSSI